MFACVFGDTPAAPTAVSEQHSTAQHYKHGTVISVPRIVDNSCTKASVYTATDSCGNRDPHIFRTLDSCDTTRRVHIAAS